MKYLFLFLFSINSWAVCVNEKVLSGFELSSLQDKYRIFLEGEEGTFFKASGLKSLQFYKVQLQPITSITSDFDDYNRRYIEYYRYSHIEKFLNKTEQRLGELDYEVTVIGQSLQKRKLFAVKPKNFDENKKTILMFGRHHGDEGTANWIIEGFVTEFLNQDENFHKEYQLVLYPMINPDGAEAQTRYNSKGRDLNRMWSVKVEDSVDEAQVINRDLQPYLVFKKNIPIVLDMHGSFTNDFIYRVKKSFSGIEFFNHQQQFIDELATFDPWQNGAFELSNGHPKMARIVMVKSHGLNALTHETPRDIKLKNSKNRSKEDLIQQGVSLLTTIQNLY